MAPRQAGASGPDSSDARKSGINPAMHDKAHGGDNVPRHPSIEMRVSSLETRLDRLKGAIDELRKELQAFRLEFVEFRAEMRGRLTNLPTSFQFAFMLAAFTVATFVGATGLALTVLKLGGH
jgi:hypothetical protein